MTQTIAVIAQHVEGQVDHVTYELVACGLEIQRFCPAPVTVIILGADVKGMATDIAGHTGLNVMGIQDTHLATYNAESYKAILEGILGDLGADYICIAHTNQGWDYAPGLAVRLNAACVSSVQRVLSEQGNICFERAAYSGKIIATLTAETNATVLTVQPGIFKVPEFNAPEPGSVDIKTMDVPCQRIRTLGVKRTKVPDAALAKAEVIVSAGRGIGKKENLDIIYRLVKLFPKSAVAGSRPVCDMGWLTYQQQVGSTGATVKPKLYLACGISGATQHLAGMRNSDFIVAINTDPNAAFFDVADVCVVEDLTTFIPALIEAYENKQKGTT